MKKIVRELRIKKLKIIVLREIVIFKKFRTDVCMCYGRAKTEWN